MQEIDFEYKSSIRSNKWRESFVKKNHLQMA